MYFLWTQMKKNSKKLTTKTAVPAAKKASTKKSAAKSTAKKPAHKWSKKVNETSDAMDLEKGIFKSKSAKKIAASIKHSAEITKRSKAKSPFQAAMAMLNFYGNRAGKNLPAAQKQTLAKAKTELRKDFRRA